ncbi:MAG TPA: PLP-dependent lyase/thiolase [Candidatus Udaeobacter sp.]|nr:PLP-dependent lyase/thiolase [Candidatus Udaeobacter sp.]
MITPQSQAKQLAQTLGLTTELYLKREDLHPYGSHKGRSIPLMIEHYTSKGKANFCISSSGNAALAAIYAIKKIGSKLNLQIFVGKHIDSKKLTKLQELVGDLKNITIKQVENPKQSAFQMEKTGQAKNLRQSTDDLALIGYETLADELMEIKNLAAIFIPTSSGTAAQGLYNAFKKYNLNPQIHIVQTSACHPMVESDIQTKNSLATAIVDKIAFRKEAVQKAIQNSQGNGWIAIDEEIELAKKNIKKTENLEVSFNSALSIAGLKLALQNNWKFNGSVVCILTGL